MPTIHHGANFTSLSFGGVQYTEIGDLIVGRQDLISLPLMMPVLTTALLILIVPKPIDRSRRLSLIVACCVVSSLAMFGVLAFYHWAATRFLYELTPLLFVVVYCALERLWESVRRRDGLRRLTLAGLGLIFCANVMMGLMAGVIAFMYSR